METITNDEIAAMDLDQLREHLNNVKEKAKASERQHLIEQIHHHQQIIESHSQQSTSGTVPNTGGGVRAEVGPTL